MVVVKRWIEPLEGLSFDDIVGNVFKHSQGKPRTLTKSEFLHSIASPKTKYKRVALSPIRYPGGKSLAVGHIVEHLPEVSRVISPFFGGGSVEIAMATKLGIEVIGGDIDRPLTNYWKHQTKHKDKLYSGLTTLKPTKDEYDRIKDICRAWRAGKTKLTPLELATYFFYNHSLSYGPSR